MTLFTKETSERNDKNNWVKNQMTLDGFCIMDYEGYTIKNWQVTGLFDRRQYDHSTDFSLLSDNDIKDIIQTQEAFLKSKLILAQRLGIHYRYVFYRYDDELIYVYRFDDHPSSKPTLTKVQGFCHFIEQTKAFRDLKMTSTYQEKDLPKIDRIFRDRCQYPWMGNLDGVLLNQNQEPVAIIEFQTTTKTLVKNHCNNTWFLSTSHRKGDEYRWRVIHTIAKQANLPLIIIVWSPHEVNGDIKLKIVSDILYKNSPTHKAGLQYTYKKVMNYTELKDFLCQYTQPSS